MTPYFASAHFIDEAPVLGSGSRIVFVERVGNLDVTVRDPVTFVSVKLKRDVWDKLNAIPVPYRASLVRKAARTITRARRSDAFDKHRSEWVRDNPFSRLSVPPFSWRGAGQVRRQRDLMLKVVI